MQPKLLQVLRRRRTVAWAAACVLGALSVSPALAFVATIGAGTKSLYLQVGAGQVTGRFDSGGTPGNNTTVNQVSVTVPAASLGTGSVNMTSNSTVTNSPYDNFNFCTSLAQVYVGGFYRNANNGAPATAQLTATAPTSLVDADGDTIPITQISWVSGGNDNSITIPSGTFTGGTQTIYTATRNTWFENCLTFRYANTAIVPAGTFTGRVTYILSAP